MKNKISIKEINHLFPDNQKYSKKEMNELPSLTVSGNFTTEKLLKNIHEFSSANHTDDGIVVNLNLLSYRDVNGNDNIAYNQDKTPLNYFNTLVLLSWE